MEPYQQLESEWAAFNDLDPQGMVACASGTAALHLALESMVGQNRGKKVILGDFNMIACPRAVVMAGMTPVFVDCRDDLNMDPQLVYNTIWDVDQFNMFGEGYTVLATHVYGRRCDMDRLCNHADNCRMYVIEDLAEAHGIRPHRFTNAACWSFYKNKIVAGEEGGAVWFRDKEHARLARQLRSLGFTDTHDFNHVPRGHNYRMSNAHAALVLSSLHRYEYSLKERRRQERLLDEACPTEWRMPERDAPWVFDFRIKGMTGAQQDAVVRHLNQMGIAARHAFKPMCDQSEFKSCKMIAADNINGTKSRLASREVVYLPLTPDRPRIDRVVFDEVKRILDKYV